MSRLSLGAAASILAVAGAASPALAQDLSPRAYLSQLTHPNTIAIYDYGRTDEGIFYYAMEYLPGIPLDVVICLAKRPEERPADAGVVLERLDAWPGVPWTQAQAREWWLTRGAPIVEARRAAAASVSQLPELEIDVDSRVRSDRRPDVTEATATRVAACPRRRMEPAPRSGGAERGAAAVRG